MIAFIIICYSLLYIVIFKKLRLLKKTAGNISAFAGVGVVLIGSIVFMWYTFSPMSSDARMFRYIIPIVPNVKGHVETVPIEPLQNLRKGDTLFRIDPEPYEIAVRQLQAQVRRYEAEHQLAEINVARAEKLLTMQAAAQVDLDIWKANRDVAQAGIDTASAQLEDARWRLQETNVTAPFDGYVVNLQLRPGSMVTSVPMASPISFVSNETNTVLASFSQSAIRRIASGDMADLVFTNLPGQTFSGKVVRIVPFGSSAQLSASSQLPTLTGAPANDRWGVLVALDDVEFARKLPQGAGGTVAIYTEAGKAFHVISKVAIRMNAWLAYLTSP